ncbi:MBL fold metallo-hydrolase [Halodesulfurarchaeum sp.]|uniref:MBL fold metallo-hydrolase n=1 Tax=Halodesulfurarchaeum sp. TaxID=1980530 RepID=UPI001BC19962|nr:MBL fold metallo-hydrolase [Halodesulfurarchaeum sp.]
MTKITILADNRVHDWEPKGLRAEWGFSVAVGNLLFDTGGTGVAAANARLLGAGPFETLVLSHGHYDHTKGLPAFLDELEEIYVHPDAFEEKYLDGEPIGMPYDRAWVEAQANVRTHSDPVKVAQGIHALGEIPREYPDNRTGEHLVEGNHVEDPVWDDQALAVETDMGLGLVLGCGHAGLRNSVTYAEEVLGEPVHTVIGGTHLRSPDAETLATIVGWLGDRIERIAPTHCTAPEAELALKDAFGEDYIRVGVGATIDL